MKKLLPILLSFLAVTLMGCSSNASAVQNDQTPPQVTSMAEETQSFTYSLMSDELTKIKIRELMLENHIPSDNVGAFFTSVNQFNELMGDMKGSTNGFKTVSYPAELFDYDYIGTTWFKNLSFDDQQCRLTSFSLLKDAINVPTTLIVPNSDLALSGDLEIEKTNPNVNFTSDELIRFKNLYTDISTNSETDAKALAAIIEQEWANRNISFDPSTKAALMSVFFISAEDQTAFVGHAGVVLETENDYILVEKLAQYAPYVASNFSTLEEMKTYLLATYTPYVASGGTMPLIFINDQWLQ